MSTPQATYLIHETVRIQMPQADGYYDLTISQARSLFDQLADALEKVRTDGVG